MSAGKFCESCRWVSKAEIGIAICVHGAKCDVHAVAVKIETVAAIVQDVPHAFHGWHLPRWHLPHMRSVTEAMDDEPSAV